MINDLRFEDGRKINEDKFFLFESIIKSKIIVFNGKCKYTYLRRIDSSSNARYSSKYLDKNYFSKRILKIINENYPDLYFEAYGDYVTNLLFVFRKLCKQNENKLKYFDDYLLLKNEIKNIKLKDLKNLSFIYKIETLFIKIFPAFYIYIVSFIYIIRKKY